jgi:hypothetical protein
MHGRAIRRPAASVLPRSSPAVCTGQALARERRVSRWEMRSSSPSYRAGSTSGTRGARVCKRGTRATALVGHCRRLGRVAYLSIRGDAWYRPGHLGTCQHRIATGRRWRDGRLVHRARGCVGCAVRRRGWLRHGATHAPHSAGRSGWGVTGLLGGLLASASLVLGAAVGLVTFHDMGVALIAAIPLGALCADTGLLGGAVGGALALPRTAAGALWVGFGEVLPLHRRDRGRGAQS